MVTPPHSPPYGRNPAFPFFNSLLDEVPPHRSRNIPRCPATAPVIPTFTSGEERNKSLLGNRAPDEMENTDLKPIALRDPPKSKLKRQLSIDTAENTERLRITKKVHTEPEVTYQMTSLMGARKTDEVDGDSNTVFGETVTVKGGKLLETDNESQYSRKIPNMDFKSDERIEPITLTKASILDRTSASPKRTILSNEAEAILITLQSDDDSKLKEAMTSRHAKETRHESEHAERLEKSPRTSSNDVINVAEVAVGIRTLHGSAQENSNAQGTTGIRTQRIDSLTVEQMNIPPSPNRFNMNDICLTSPFLSKNPRSMTSQDSDVFTFPEQITQSTRRVSPYRQRLEDVNAAWSDAQRQESNLNVPQLFRSEVDVQESIRPEMMSPEIGTREVSRESRVRNEGPTFEIGRQDDTRHGSDFNIPVSRDGSISQQTMRDVHTSSPSRYQKTIQEADRQTFSEGRSRLPLRTDENRHPEKAYPSYVTSKGFEWPTNVTLSEPPVFSPRVVATEAKPRFPSTSPHKTTSSTSSSHVGIGRYESYEEQLSLLRMLEQESARAKQYFGISPRNENDANRAAYRAREKLYRNDILRRETLRSISDVERSPNEKEIKQTADDVRNQYERSISEPFSSARQMWGILHHVDPSGPLGQAAREREMDRERDRVRTQAEMTHEPPSPDRSRDRMMHDVRRRLFMKSDPFSYSRGVQRRSLFEPDDDVNASGSPYIPEELLHFLHSRHFYPEELDNLKDYRESYLAGGMASTMTSPVTSSSEHVTSRFARSSSHYDAQKGGDPYLRHDDVDFRRRNLPERFPEQGMEGRSSAPFRDRHAGDIHVRVTCDNVSHGARSTDEILRELEHECKDGKCNRIEEEIRFMAMDAYRKIRRSDSSVASFNQFQNEINETNTNVYNSMRVLCGIKCMCKYGRTLEDIFPGSIVFRLNCPNIDALLDLWRCFTSGQLQKQLQDAFITEDLLRKFGCDSISLKVEIDWDEYSICKRELERSLQTQIRASPSTACKASPGGIVHVRSRSEPASVSKQANLVSHPAVSSLSPFRERFCSDSSVELSPRRVFQEINGGKDAKLPQSPSRKSFHDNVFFSDDNSSSPLTSPRRKVSGVNAHAHLEQENVDHTGSPTLRQKNFHDTLRDGNQISDV